MAWIKVYTGLESYSRAMDPGPPRMAPAYRPTSQRPARTGSLDLSMPGKGSSPIHEPQRWMNASAVAIEPQESKKRSSGLELHASRSEISIIEVEPMRDVQTTRKSSKQPRTIQCRYSAGLNNLHTREMKTMINHRPLPF
jgi:hypothetical protein